MKSSLLVFLILIGLGSVVGSAGGARAEAPEALSYQGHLLLTNGRSASDGSYLLRFSIFPSAVGGTSLFTTELQVRVHRGQYHVVLSAAPGVLARAAGASGRFLEVEILGGPDVAEPETLTPRQSMAAVPYALSAGRADRAVAITGQSGAPSPEEPPPGAVFLSVSEGGCPSGYELLDGSSGAGGAAIDMRARFPAGADLGGTAQTGVAATEGQPGGSSTHTHTHQNDANGVVIPDEPAPFGTGSSNLIDPASRFFGAWSSGDAATAKRARHAHTGAIPTATSVPPFATVQFCRKT